MVFPIYIYCVVAIMWEQSYVLVLHVHAFTLLLMIWNTQNPVSGWILMMRSLIKVKSLMCVQHECEIWLRSSERISWIKIHPITGFYFYHVMWFFNIFPLFIFILNVIDNFFTVTVVVAWSKQVNVAYHAP